MVGKEGVKPDNYTYPLVFKACSALFDLDLARKMYDSMRADEGVKPNIFVDCTLVDMFTKCGSLDEAKSIFERMPERDIVTWGAMIGGAIECGDSGEALALFRRMIMDGFRPDSVIIATVLPLCGRIGDFHMGMGLHGWGIKSGIDSDLCLSNALLDMYCKCGQTHEACQVFSRMECRDVISWSSLIAGYSQNCEYAESLHLYMQMKGSGLKPSTITIASVLPAFAEKRLFKEGKAIHGYVIRHGFVSDTFVSSSLIDLYSKCGSLGDAEQVFEAASDKDITIWNSMIMGYTANGDVEVAFRTLRRIHNTKLFKPNSVTLVTVLPLCNWSAMLRQGQECHGYAIRGGFESVTSVQNSLIDMYCKCGYIGLGQNVFDQMERRDVVTYNTIIAALGMHGHGDQALALFKAMTSEGIRPDKVTFIMLLSACSHAGLVEMGRAFYHSMIEEHGIVPDMEHYSCMVDLFGRSGCIKEAWEFIRSMPVEADIDVLGSLLGACRVHDQLELAEQIGREIFDRNPDDPGYHVLLSNAYAAAGRWEDSMRVRMMFTGRGLVKKPANSWIQGRRGFHAYIVRD
ncbi:Pentatricopeptide repeat-containing protein [Acorus calamus]|uniref:Pentatricopeptide repeat-containing protein n=1 Tax=Acorus calamus TaxID=4465 RepID=A0AAV9F063_ACOCL|nr:Pentatricopeptide repeat-containing protein [Acorus calamus]